MHVAPRIDARVDPGEALPQGGGKIGVRGIEHVSVALSDDHALHHVPKDKRQGSVSPLLPEPPATEEHERAGW